MTQFIELYGYRVLPQEITHIEKHKYFMSIDAQMDVGMEAAVIDWFQRFRQDFAEWYNQQDISEQMIALNLHLARLKSQSIHFEETEEINRFAKHWRIHHPRILSDNEEETPTISGSEAICAIRFVSDNGVSGAVISKRICLINGLHIRPGVHLYHIMHDRHDVRMLLHNDNVAKVAAFCPQFIHEVEGLPFFDVTPVNILEFLEVAAQQSGATISIFVESSNDSLISEVCRELCFLDREFFCTPYNN